jgi:hypothetical protein
MDTKNYTDYRSLHVLLTEPMNQKELEDNVRKDGTIQAQVVVTLEESLDNDLEYFNDVLSSRVTGSEAGLTDIGYDLAGSVTGTNEMIIRVTGHVEFDNL